MSTTRRIRTGSPPPEIAESIQTSIVMGGLFVAVLGWSGVIWSVMNTLPIVPNRWLLYAFLQAAISGSAVPFVRYLHQRFSRNDGRNLPAHVLVRQAIWVGLFVSLCVWLRIPRVLSLPLALVVLFALIVIEFLLRLRERAQWHPD